MAKRKHIRQGGQLVCGVVYTANPTKSTDPHRAAKRLPSASSRQLINLKFSWQKLELMLATNFSMDDLFVTYTFDDEYLPYTRADTMKYFRKHVKKLREHRRNATGEALLYIYCIEGQHGDHRHHVHAVVNATGADFATIQSFWPWGNVDFETVESRGYDGWAAYMTKEPREEGKGYVGERMWTPCKGLRRPHNIKGWWPAGQKMELPPEVEVKMESRTVTEYGEFWHFKGMVPAGYVLEL